MRKRTKRSLGFTVRETDTPPYELSPYEVEAGLQRFDEREAALYSALFQEKVMKGESWRARQAAVARRKIGGITPGFRQLEYAFSEAAWTSYRPYDASPLMHWVERPERQLTVEAELSKQGRRWEGSARENSRHLKRASYFFGAAAVGITALNELWFYATSKEGLPIIFSEAHDTPELTAEAKIIPRGMNRVIVMLVPQDRDLMAFSPSLLAGAAVGLGYSRMAEVASKTAAFIRGLGYMAVPMGNDTGLSVPLAIDAGLGELGRHGMLINPRFGSLVRICKVLTDLPLGVDKPVVFGAADFCRNCTTCAEQCPSRAISFDRDTTLEPSCPSNNPGVKKWPVNSWDCLKFWANNGRDCGICQVACPFSRPGKTAQAGGKAAVSRQAGLKYNDPLQWWEQ